MWKDFFSIKKNLKDCSHPKTVTLSTIAVVSWGFSLFSQLAKTGRTSLGLICIASLLGLAFLVEPHLNILVPFRRLRIFDNTPPLLVIFSSILISFISMAYLVARFFFVKHEQLIVGDPYLSAMFRVITILFVAGVIFRLVWPHLRDMDIAIEVIPAEDHVKSSEVK